MAKTLLCEIVTPERITYRNEVEMVVAPTPDGEIGVLPLHAPLVTLLAPGELRVRFNDGKDVEWFAISGGYLQVHEDKVIVLADDAVPSSQIDVERARQAKALIEQRMAELKERAADEHDEIASCVEDLAWCEVQLRVAQRRS